MGTPLSALIVEDDARAAAVLVERLTEAGFDVTHERVASATDMRARLATQPWDVVLSGLEQPALDARRALATLQAEGTDIPFIVVADTPSEDTAIELMRAGANDFLVKDNLARLAPAVSHEVGEARLRRERDRAKAAVDASRQRYIAAIESTLDGYAVVGPLGRFLEINDSMCALTGYSREELLRLSVPDVEAGQTEEAFAACFATVTDSGRARFECRWKRKGGDLIDVEVVATSHRRDGVEMFIFIHDITARKRNEAELRRHVQEAERARGALLSVLEDQREAQSGLLESEERFRGMLEQNIAAIFMVEDGRLTFANRRAGEILGRSTEELAGARMLDLVVHADRPKVDAMLRRLLSGESKTTEESFGALRKDGNLAEIGAHVVLATLQGKTAVLGIAQDIGERRKAQEEIERYIARLESSVLATLEAVSLMVELRDPYTSGHERRVGDLAAAIGEEMGLGAHVVKGLRLTGHVHDIGKISAPAEILSKPGVLTPMERELIKSHCQSGYDVLKGVDFPWPLAEVILQHHERLDGSGYPRKLRGDEILVEARIISVADVVEAMANHRPYRPGLGLQAALEEIEAGSGTLYDAQVCSACLTLFRDRGYALPS